jgi:DNA-binding transcriptional ArsR family regulator
MSEIPQDLDRVFEALANEHRRQIIYQVGFQPYAIHQLAALCGITLQAIHKHIRILEAAGLVKRRKIGRTNFLTLNRKGVRSLQGWLDQYHVYWGSEEESLENYAEFLKQKRRASRKGRP